MKTDSRALFPRLPVLAASLALAGLPCARSQILPPVRQLEPLVVTATRTSESADTLGSAVDVVSGADLARRQLLSFGDALGGVPGAPVFATGQTGASTSVFLRGSNSNQTLFLVDGIRLNDANTDYGVFLGGARVCPCDSLEIAHGPQSTLYGGEAVGGVVSLRAQPGAGAPTEAVSAEAGSFGTAQGALSAQGASGPWAYDFAAAGGRTDNQRVNNSFDSGNFTLRLDRSLSPDLALGATLRGFEGRYGDPGDRFTNSPGDFERENNWLGTFFSDVRLTDDILSHLTLGGQDRRFVSVSPVPGRPAQVTLVKNRRGVADWQNTFRLAPGNQLVAGVTAESETTLNTGFGSIDKRQKLFAVFAEDQWSPLPDVFLTGGVRHDDFDTFGGASTGRATAAWLPIPHVLKLRASYGTGFNSPSFLDLYGTSAFFVGNPALKPERSRGKDAGVDFYLPADAGVLGVTLFQTDYRDLIVDNFNVFPGTTANVQRARTRGIEASAKLPLPGGLRGEFAYTYLEAANQTTRTPLLRRPRDSGNLDLSRDFGGGFSLGVGGTLVGRRADVDAQTFATVYDPGYGVWRAYAAWKATSRLTLKARVENLLGRKYEPVNGYPALGAGVFAGAEMRF